MPKANYWVNDGLAIGFGTRTVDQSPADVVTAGTEHQLVVKVPFAQVLANAAVPATGSLANAAVLPANARVTSVRAICDTAFTGAGGAVLVGTYTQNADTGVYTAADADGLATSTEITTAAMTAAGKVVNCTAGAIVGKTTVGSAPVYVAVTQHTTAITAGAFTLVIEYVPA